MGRGMVRYFFCRADFSIWVNPARKASFTTKRKGILRLEA